MTNFKWIVAPAILLASAASFAGECQVEIDPGWNLYIVTNEGAKVKDVRYMTFDDAARLRDFFVSSGECSRPRKLAQCTVKPKGNAGFIVTRNGRNFDPFGKYASFKKAARQASRMAKSKLCTFDLKRATSDYQRLAKGTKS